MKEDRTGLLAQQRKSNKDAVSHRLARFLISVPDLGIDSTPSLLKHHGGSASVVLLTLLRRVLEALCSTQLGDRNIYGDSPTAHQHTVLLFFVFRT